MDGNGRRGIAVKATAVAMGLVGFALAACGQPEGEVGEFKNDLTGNEIKIQALEDPKVQGVTCHLSHFDRGVLDRLVKGNWFEDPSNASIACHQTAPIVIGDISLKRKGEEVFTQKQSLFFKTIAVRRILDRENKTLIYVVYSRRPVEGSAKMSISTVSLFQTGVDLPPSEDEADS